MLVNGLGQSTSVTLTATLGAAMQTAGVRVIDPTEQPSTVSLTPLGPTAAPGATVSFTVTLDLPAPMGGTVVALALNRPGRARSPRR